MLESFKKRCFARNLRKRPNEWTAVEQLIACSPPGAGFEGLGVLERSEPGPQGIVVRGDTGGFE